MRGYFAIGVEGISKSYNLGSLMRTSHAFGAAFLFTVNAKYQQREGGKIDTSRAPAHVPLFEWDSIDDMDLPKGVQLVAIELTEDAVDLPSFRHPMQAAYILGPEKGSLSPEMTARADHVVKIPTRFCVNVAMAGALVMYDRLRCLGSFPARPISPGGPTEPKASKPVGSGRVPFTRKKKA